VPNTGKALVGHASLCPTYPALHRRCPGAGGRRWARFALPNLPRSPSPMPWRGWAALGTLRFARPTPLSIADALARVGGVGHASLCPTYPARHRRCPGVGGRRWARFALPNLPRSPLPMSRRGWAALGTLRFAQPTPLSIADALAWVGGVGHASLCPTYPTLHRRCPGVGGRRWARFALPNLPRSPSPMPWRGWAALGTLRFAQPTSLAIADALAWVGGVGHAPLCPTYPALHRRCPGAGGRRWARFALPNLPRSPSPIPWHGWTALGTLRFAQPTPLSIADALAWVDGVGHAPLCPTYPGHHCRSRRRP